MRKLLLLMLMMVSVQMNAQDNQQKIIKLPQWVNDIKLSGIWDAPVSGQRQEGEP